MEMQAPPRVPAALVLDTNIVLDLFVFDDPGAQPLRASLRTGQWRWIATEPMREELARVLAYPQIARRLQQSSGLAAQVLACFDAQVQMVAVAAKASATCKDPDDQKFIDLAVAHQAHLFSKDHAVLCMRKRLLALTVIVLSAIQ